MTPVSDACHAPSADVINSTSFFSIPLRCKCMHSNLMPSKFPADIHQYFTAGIGDGMGRKRQAAWMGIIMKAAVPAHMRKRPLEISAISAQRYRCDTGSPRSATQPVSS